MISTQVPLLIDLPLTEVHQTPLIKIHPWQCQSSRVHIMNRISGWGHYFFSTTFLYRILDEEISLIKT